MPHTREKTLQTLHLARDMRLASGTLQNAAPGNAAGLHKKGNAPQPAFHATSCPPHHLVVPIVCQVIEEHS